MQHLHLNQCSSTQALLKEKFVDLERPILVSTDLQKDGFGRKGSNWSHFEYALAFSFTLPLNQTLTLTPLEVGCLLSDFFKPNLLLKWPNDLINQRGEKVGGILCQLVGKSLIVGVGLNLLCVDTKEFDYPVGGIFEELPNLIDDYKKSLPLKIYHSISENRLSPDLVRERFNHYCCHLNKQVSIIDGSKKSNGLFIGISKLGEAILKKDNEEPNKVLTGSLRF